MHWIMHLSLSPCPSQENKSFKAFKIVLQSFRFNFVDLHWIKAIKSLHIVSTTVKNTVKY